MVNDVRSYDIIAFGDEVPGVLAIITAAREHFRRNKKYPRILLMSKGNMQEGIGGILVRGGLSYLDRSQVDQDLRDSLGLNSFGDPPAIYKEFLQKSGVVGIGLDPQKASLALRQMLSENNVDLLSRIDIKSVTKTGKKLSIIITSNGSTYTGKIFIDSTINAELAQAAGVQKLTGFASLGLPDAELPVTLIFETQGITPEKLKDIELNYLNNFTNTGNSAAQKSLLSAAGMDAKQAENLRKNLLDKQGKLKTLWIGPDYIDIRSSALSIAYQAFRGKKLSLLESGAILDSGNIAILGNSRLSWNALLFTVTATQAEELAKADGKPTPAMLQEFAFIEKWFKSIGATAVIPASELYIRHAGNVTGVVNPLTGAEMLSGGVPVNEALGTFAYHFDVRGGISGIGPRAKDKGFSNLTFSHPIFNIGIRHALIKDIPNLAVVSPASGFEGLAAAAGRIVEFNVGVGQGVGIAAIIALLNNRNLADISNQEVKQVLVATSKLSRIFGMDKTAEASRLNQLEGIMA